MGVNRVNEFWPEWSVGELLGEGSYGKVYRTVKSEGGLNSESALKVISIPNTSGELRSLYSEGMSDLEARTYLGGIVSDFITEIKLMENLKTAANVVAVEDYKVLEKKGEIGWDIYIRMELLKPFDRVMIERGFDEDEVVKLGIDICTALEACARHRIIHRDIKPANIFLSKFGDYKIGDFGIAKELEKTTAAMSSKGTYSYMAPEVAHGHKYDSTVDIYSLGIVMYVLLNNNRQPFIDPHKVQVTYNDKKDAVDKRLSGQMLPKPCNASDELSTIILTACSYNPRMRYQSADAFKNALNYYKSRKLVSLGGSASANSASFVSRDNYGKAPDLNSTTAFREKEKAQGKPEQWVQTDKAGNDKLLERVFMFIEDGDWQNAAAYCERVLDNDPKNALAYLGRLMTALGVRNIKYLGGLFVPFDANINYKKIMQYGDEALKRTVYDYNCNVIYNLAIKRYEAGDVIGAAILFKRISGYYDADRYYIELMGILERQNRENDERRDARFGLKAIQKVESKVLASVIMCILFLAAAGVFHLVGEGILFDDFNMYELWLALKILSAFTALIFFIRIFSCMAKRHRLIGYNKRSAGFTDEIKDFLRSSGLVMISDKTYYVKGLGTYIYGYIKCDVISVGDSVLLHGERCSVYDIETQNKDSLEARFGDYVALRISTENLGLANEIPLFKA